MGNNNIGKLVRVNLKDYLPFKGHVGLSLAQILSFDNMEKIYDINALQKHGPKPFALILSETTDEMFCEVLIGDSKYWVNEIAISQI